MNYYFKLREPSDDDVIETDDYLEHKYSNSAAEHVTYVYSPEKTFHNYLDGYVAGFDVEGTIVAPWYPISSSQIQVGFKEYEMKKISSIQSLKKEIESKVKSRLPAGAVLPSSESAKAAARLWVLYTDYKGSHNKKDMSHSSDTLLHAQKIDGNKQYYYTGKCRAYTTQQGFNRVSMEFMSKQGKGFGLVIDVKPNDPNETLNSIRLKAEQFLRLYHKDEYFNNQIPNNQIWKACEDALKQLKRDQQHAGYYSPNLLGHSVTIDSSMCAVVPAGEELSHYGVEGMKWGVRRYQNPDGTLTAAGREHYGKGGIKEVKNEGVGAALAFYAAVTIGPYAVLSAMAAGISAAEAHKEKKREQKAEAELFGEGKDYGLTMDDVKKVNPHYSEDRNYKINCPKCSTVVELRKRGMNVSANTGSGQTDKEMAAWFKGAKPKENLHVDAAKETILSFPAGSSGFISGKYNYMGGHVVHWTNIGNNTIRIEDGQVGKVYTWDQFKETYPFQIDRYTVTRLDNCKINEKLMKDQAVFVEYKEEKK